MRKLLYILFCVTAAPAFHPAAFAATTVPAGTVNGHWTLSGSPYKVTGHIIVPNGDSLIIDPGVVVEFQGKYKLFCNGKILANGTAGSGGILFTIATAAAGAGWLGIRYDQTPTTNDTSRFSYCTIEGGKADVAGDDMGGAFYFRDFSKCSIGHCTIRNNYAIYGGGAIHASNAAPHIFNDTFINNTAYNGGYGIEFVKSSGALIEQCYFSTGGVYGGYCSFTVRDCTFQNCIDEGAISTFSDGNSPHTNSEYLLIERNIFIGNKQKNGGGGGAVLLFNTAGKIEHNIFSNNVADGGGGAISIFTQTAYPNSSTTIISNNLLYKNKAKGTGGGGIYFSNCSGKVINNTIVNNASDYGDGGGIYLEAAASPAFYNNIIYGDTAHGIMEAVFIKDNPSDPDFYNNDLEGGYSAINTNGTPLVGANVGNINLAPGFTSPAANNYSLATGSPCIDAGTTTGITPLVPSLDLAAAARIMGTAIDMGAYEVLGTSLGIPGIAAAPLSIYPTPASGYLSIGNVRPDQVASIQIWSADGRLLAGFAGRPDNRYDIRDIHAGTLFVRVITRDNKAFTGVVPKY